MGLLDKVESNDKEPAKKATAKAAKAAKPTKAAKPAKAAA